MKRILPVGIIACILLAGCSLYQSTQLTTEEKNGPKTEQAKNQINLHNQNLKNIPDYVFGLTQLETLDVSNNQLSGAIQVEIRHLEHLRVLDLSDNNMTGVPAEIGQLRHLEVLNLANNQLTGLPHELGNLQHLQILDISGNAISAQDLEVIRQKLPKDVTIIE